MITDTSTAFVQDLGLASDYENKVLNAMLVGETRYIKDLKITLKNALSSQHLTEKEAHLTAYAIAVNNTNTVLQQLFYEKSQAAGATNAEIAEAAACASLLAANNVAYRFRHFLNKEKYNTMPLGIRMNIMANPVLGKELFELISLAVSAVNGCEMCVNAHENTLLQHGCTEERIFDAMRIGAAVTSLGKVIF